MVKVTVPASTANIGPGFDTLGLALSLYNVYSFEEVGEDIVIEGCPEIYNNKDNLVYKSFAYTAEKLGKSIKGLKITMDTQIPVSRGLGSSSACIVGGVYGANAIFKAGLSIDEMFLIAVEIEGHPDNIAPCIYGGLTASIVEKERPYCIQYSISDKLKFCALIPNFETSTIEARKILPKKVAFSDAVFNISRVSVLLKALEIGDLNLIGRALKDKLHQTYRATLIHECAEVSEICCRDGSKAIFISGSGPTLMNIVDNDEFSEKIKSGISKLKHRWEIKELEVDRDGAKVEIT
ncbi:MAG: homoserine kinase [Tissierellia bacterium]|nr:homoserine kinase [Tissierellia bacterium]